MSVPFKDFALHVCYRKECVIESVPVCTAAERDALRVAIVQAWLKCQHRLGWKPDAPNADGLNYLDAAMEQTRVILARAIGGDDAMQRAAADSLYTEQPTEFHKMLDECKPTPHADNEKQG